MKKKKLKDLIEDGILKIGEEINMPYRGTEYKGTLTREGKIKTELGTFSLGDATIKLMTIHPEYNRKRPNAYGCSWWKNKQGIKLQDLRDGKIIRHHVPQSCRNGKQFVGIAALLSPVYTW